MNSELDLLFEVFSVDQRMHKTDDGDSIVVKDDNNTDVTCTPLKKVLISGIQ